LIKHFAENGVFYDESFCDGLHVLIDCTCGRGVQVWRCDFFPPAGREIRSRQTPDIALLLRRSEAKTDDVQQQTGSRQCFNRQDAEDAKVLDSPFQNLARLAPWR
jgi:hypothetical protein